MVRTKESVVSRVPVSYSEVDGMIGEIRFAFECPGRGWVECNGQNGTVDTRETRLFGVAETASTGIRANDQMIQHTHTASTKQVGPVNYRAYGDNPSTQSVGYLNNYTTNRAGTSGSITGLVTGTTSASYSRSKTYYIKMWTYVGE